MKEFFRASVGAMIIDAQDRVLAFQRAGASDGAWQLPQGGVEPDETTRQAVYREIREETGLVKEDLALLAESPHWLSYELPLAYRSKKTGRGQTQKWFLFRLTGNTNKIRPDHKEFVAYRWMARDELLQHAVEFRRDVYGQVFDEFAKHLTTEHRDRT
jgi:putative (di)nucleoside polyphosphate hydrolase